MAADILLGVVIGAQGLKGEVKVKTFTESPDGLGAYGPLHKKDGRMLKIRAIRSAKADVAVVHFDGVADRDAAEALKGAELYVARDALPAPADEEFYHADLIGLPAEDEAGHALGTVSGLHNFGAGDVLALRAADGREILVPFTRERVPVVDVKNRRIVVVAFADEAAQS